MRHPIETVLTHLEYRYAVRRSFERDIATVCIVEILSTLMSYYGTVSSRGTTIVVTPRILNPVNDLHKGS